MTRPRLAKMEINYLKIKGMNNNVEGIMELMKYI